MTIRTLIVDDEPLARKRIRSLLAADPEIEVAGECGDGASAVTRLLEARPDLVFLDVQMPELDGFEVLRAVAGEHAPVVVFVTAFDRYAVKAFETHALDYLLKPFKRQRFQEALRRAKTELHDRTRQSAERMAALLSQLAPASQRLVVRSSGRIVVLRPADLDWVEAAANYVCLHAGPHQYLVRETLGAFEKRLPAGRFLRIHRSYVVNLDRIRELQPCNGSEYMVLLRNGKELPLSRSYRDAIESALEVQR